MRDYAEELNLPPEVGSQSTKRFNDIFRTRYIKRKQYLIYPGLRCDRLFYVKSGLFKLYALNEEGKEHILHFFQENQWTTDFFSIQAEKESILYLEAIEDAVIYEVSNSERMDLMKKDQVLLEFFLGVFSKLTLLYQNKLLDMALSNSDERYFKFLATNPGLANRISNKEMAYYLGITPEFVTKIKRPK